MLIPKRTTLSHRVPDAHKGLVDFISYLLLVDPHKRPSAAEALQHPFMAEDYYS
jgi:serine/threonine protein kinase